MDNVADPTDPHGRLIAAGKVQGATVFNAELEELGSIDDIMIEKHSGRIAYAILAAGGFLGIGEHHYPIPWEKLRFDTEMNGYIVDIDRSVLQGAPSYSGEAAWNDDAWTRNVYTYYGVHPFWDIAP